MAGGTKGVNCAPPPAGVVVVCSSDGHVLFGVLGQQDGRTSFEIFQILSLPFSQFTFQFFKLFCGLPLPNFSRSTRTARPRRTRATHYDGNEHWQVPFRPVYLHYDILEYIYIYICHRQVLMIRSMWRLSPVQVPENKTNTNIYYTASPFNVTLPFPFPFIQILSIR